MIFQDALTSLNPTMKIGKQIMENLIIHRHMNKKAAKEEAEKAAKEKEQVADIKTCRNS